jgi:hypothetical protein
MPEYSRPRVNPVDHRGQVIREAIIDQAITPFRCPPGSYAETKVVETVKPISGEGAYIQIPVGTRVRVIGVRDDGDTRVVEVVDGPAAGWRAAFRLGDIEPAA